MNSFNHRSKSIVTHHRACGEHWEQPTSFRRNRWRQRKFRINITNRHLLSQVNAEPILRPVLIIISRMGTSRHEVCCTQPRMTKRMRHLCALGLLGTMTINLGCQQIMDYTPPRSLVLRSKILQELCDTAPKQANPWYATRNDERLATHWGNQSVTVEESKTFYYERQHQVANHVHDYLNIRTHRSISTRSLR